MVTRIPCEVLGLKHEVACEFRIKFVDKKNVLVLINIVAVIMPNSLINCKILGCVIIDIYL